MPFKRRWQDELYLFVEIPALIALAVLGMILLPFVWPFCVWKRPKRYETGAYYDHHKEG